jgi:uncharacterized membrane protein YhaH (DUF805 family)
MQRILPYFSFQGRANRQRYWVTGVTLAVFAFLALFVLASLTEIPVIGPVFGLLLVAAGVVALWAMFANSARRLHDRGKSAWWLLLFQALPLLLSALGAVMRSGGEDGMAASAVLSVLSLPLSIWAFVELGCLKGATGPNRFGADPLAPALDEVFA